MYGGLDGVGDTAELDSQLILDSGQAGVQKRGVGQDQREQETAELVKAVLEPHKVLGEVLNDLKEPSGSLFLLEKFASKSFDLGPVEEAHSSGGNSHGQGDGP